MKSVLFLVFALALLTIPTGCKEGEGADRNPLGPNPSLGEIDERLIGTWDQIAPDVQGVILTPELLKVTAESIAYGGGHLGAEGLVAGAGGGQIWQATADLKAVAFYRFDYRLSAGGDTLYLVEEETATATNPGPDTRGVEVLAKRGG